MARRFPGPANGQLVNRAINLSPFIDVIVVLLVILMIAAPRPDHPSRPTTRTEGPVRVQNQAADADDLGPVIAAATGSDREERLQLLAAQSLTYGTVLHMMNPLHATGLRHVALTGTPGVGQ